MSARAAPRDYLPTLPAASRLLGVAVAIGIGWITTLGASLLVVHMGWIVAGAFTQWLAAAVRAATGYAMPVIGAAPDALAVYLDVITTTTLLLAGAGGLIYALRPLGRSIRRLAGPSVRPAGHSHPLQTLARSLARQSRLPTPVVWVTASPAPVAFAISAPFGRRAIVLSKGLVEGLSAKALAFVIAHEVGHLRYRDTDSAALWLAAVRSMNIFLRVRALIIRLVIAIFGRIPLIRDLLLLPVLGVTRVLHVSSRLGLRAARFVFLLTDRWASRHMEYRADAFAAALTSPQAGVAALEALEGDAEPIFNGLFATHPPIRQRIAVMHAATTTRN
jgi:Zn-dependent protease with chaperone function